MSAANRNGYSPSHSLSFEEGELAEKERDRREGSLDGVLGVSPRFLKSPKVWGTNRGLDVVSPFQGGQQGAQPHCFRRNPTVHVQSWTCKTAH